MSNVRQVITAILLTAILMMGGTSSGYAQEEETKRKTAKTNRAERFFNECVEKPVIDLDEQTDMAFCACAATHLQSWLDEQEEDMDFGFFDETEETEIGENVLMVDIYAPCLYIPEYELTYNDCLGSDKINYFMSEPRRAQGMCACLAEADSLYFEQYAQPFLQMKIAKEERIIDPITEIKRDTNYYDAYYTAERYCFKDWATRE